MLPYEFDFFHKDWPNQIYHANPQTRGYRHITWTSALTGNAYSADYVDLHVQTLLEDGTWIMIGSVDIAEDDSVLDVSTIL